MTTDSELHCLSTAHHAPHGWRTRIPTERNVWCPGFDASADFDAERHAAYIQVAVNCARCHHNITINRYGTTTCRCGNQHHRQPEPNE